MSDGTGPGATDAALQEENSRLKQLVVAMSLEQGDVAGCAAKKF
jgi:hypothetical protein